jgi:hypothetical protein
MTGSRLRLAIEIAVALTAALSLAASLIRPDWIELLLDASPDGGDGGAEWAISFAAAASFLVSAWLARGEWRRAARERTASG